MAPSSLNDMTAGIDTCTGAPTDVYADGGADLVPGASGAAAADSVPPATGSAADPPRPVPRPVPRQIRFPCSTTA